jgi:hypothetical protein
MQKKSDCAISNFSGPSTKCQLTNQGSAHQPLLKNHQKALVLNFDAKNACVKLLGPEHKVSTDKSRIGPPTDKKKLTFTKAIKTQQSAVDDY